MGTTIKAALGGALSALLVLLLFMPIKSTGAGPSWTAPSAITTAGGISQGLADTLYCKLTGCTMTGGLTISGVTTDISTPGSEDLTLTAGSGVYNLTGSDGTSAMQVTTSTGGSWAIGKNASAQGRIQVQSNAVIIGGTSAGTLNTMAACVSGSMGTATGATCTRGTSPAWFDGAGAITGAAAVSGNGNLSSTIACDSSKVRTELWYVDTGTNHTSKCLCEQTGASTYGWVAASGTGDCT